MKKTLSIFVIALFLFTPMTTNAGLFDFFNNFKVNQPAQVIKSSNSFERGDKDEKILEVQTTLKDQGIYDGWLSGAFGPKTEAAIKDFQSKNGLNTTGVLDQKTYEYIVGGTEKDNNSRGGGQSGSGNQPLTAFEAMCNQNNPLWVKVLSPADNAQYASNYVAQPVFALCRMAGLGANNSLSIRMEYGGFVDVIQGQTNISNSTVFDVTNPYPNIWYIEYLPGIDFANDYDGDGEYEIKAIFHNDIYPGVDAMDEVSIQIGSNQQTFNDHTDDDEACNMTVLTPEEGGIINAVSNPQFTTLIEVDLGDTTANCMWSTFEGVAGTVSVINQQTGDTIANQVGPLQLISSTDPNPYSTNSQNYYMATLEFVDPLPPVSDGNTYLVYTEAIGDQNSVDRLFMNIEVMGDTTSPVCQIIPDLVSTQYTNLLNDLTQFEITFDVTSVDCDIYLNENVERDVPLGMNEDNYDLGVRYGITKDGVNNYNNFNQINDILTCDSNCQSSNGGYEIEEGEVSRFTLTTVMDPIDSGLFRMSLNSLSYWENGNPQNEFVFTDNLGPNSSFVTDYVFIQ